MDVSACERTIPKAFVLEDVFWKGRRFALKSPVTLNVRLEDGYLYIDYPELDIHAAGQDYDALLDDFSEDFVFAWGNYACEDDAAMTADARELKKTLLSLASETAAA